MQDKLAQAYARLSALKTNLPETYTVEQKYVSEFHSILQVLERVSQCDLGSFRVPPEEVKPRWAGGNTLTGETWYTDEPECERSFLMMKIDGVLTFFSIVASPQKISVGFTAH